MKAKAIKAVKSSKIVPMVRDTNGLYINGNRILIKDATAKLKTMLNHKNSRPRLIIGQDLKFISSIMTTWVFLSEHNKPMFADPIQIKVARNTHDMNSFYYKTVNGIWEDFSYKKAIALPKSRNLEDINDAFRFEVFSDCMEEKRRLGYERVTGYQLDHVKPFWLLLKEFLTLENLDVSSIAVLDVCKGFYRKCLADRKLAERWVKYHQTNATYQILTDKDNYQKGGKVS